MLSRERHLGYFFAGPVLIILTFVMVFPLAYGFVMSLFENQITVEEFAGFSNYSEVLRNPGVWRSLLITFIFAAGSGGLKLILGMALALLLDRSSVFHSVARVLVLIPWMIAESVVGVIWRWILDPSFGVLNYSLLRTGLISESIAWFGDPRFALLSTIIVKTWVGLPFMGLMILAGLQAVPVSQHEAAIVDGANSWQVFRFVTLPNLRHVIATAVTLDFIWTMRSMATVYVLTRGGPVDATKIIPIRIYEEGFEFMRFGTATAMSVVLFCVLLAFIAGIIRSRVSEQAY